jgi:hypothetical protein
MNYEAIFKHAAQALARFEIPDFDNFSENEVCDAFSEAMSGYHFADWLLFMQQEISDISGNSVEFAKASFTTGIKGINRQFILKKGDREQKVVVGPYMPPIMFWG